jgi:WD40 repeat protein
MSMINDNTLKIYKNNNLIYTLNGHSGTVYKVIELENNKLISSAADNTMKIWEFDGNKYNCINTFTISNSNHYTNILRINKDKLVSSAYSSNYIKFWDIKNNFNEIKTLNNIETCVPNAMSMINDNILLIGGYSSGIYIINTDNYEIISQVHKNIKYVNSIIELMNGNILIGCYDENNKYSLIEYKYENNNLIKILSKDNAHSNAIYGLIEMDDGISISCSGDKIIKYWN